MYVGGKDRHKDRDREVLNIGVVLKGVFKGRYTYKVPYKDTMNLYISKKPYTYHILLFCMIIDTHGRSLKHQGREM